MPTEGKAIFHQLSQSPREKARNQYYNANHSLAIPITSRPGEEALTRLRVLVFRVREREVGVGPAGQAGTAP